MQLIPARIVSTWLPDILNNLPDNLHALRYVTPTDVYLFYGLRNSLKLGRLPQWVVQEPNLPEILRKNQWPTLKQLQLSMGY